MRHSRHHFETPPPPRSSAFVRSMVQTAEMLLIVTAVYVSYVLVLPYVEP